MPGLLGIISLSDAPLAPDLLARMRAPLLHRAWYQTDDYHSADGQMAVARVHLGTFSPEPQPLAYRGGRVHIWAYGEIYHDRPVPLSAPELVWQQYEQAGPDGLTRLKGSFVVLLADADVQTVWLINDRIGSKPLYYYQDATAFYFAPEQKSLLALPCLSRQLYAPAAADFLTNGQFTANHTLIAGVRVLDNATVLQFNPDGQVRPRRYWTFTFDEEGRDLGAAHYREELIAHLRLAVHRTLCLTDRCGVLLSGGYDSRAILGCCLEEHPAATLNTVSWGREEALPQSDCAVARQLSEQLGTPHGFYALSSQ
jgi:asparagine synthase (glutamine-hydrolysing)